MNKHSFLLLGALCCCSASAVAAPAPEPVRVIQQTADELVAALEGRRDELRDDPEALYEIASDVFLPRFDTGFAGRLMLGTHSREATPEQRQRFIDAFYQLLLLTYAKGLIHYDEDRVRILPYRAQRGERLARVRTEVMIDARTRVPVDYKLRLTGGEWKVYDVLVEGISYVQSQRRVIDEAIDRKGLEPFIEELERMARQQRSNARIVRPAAPPATPEN